jgi:hypothetical protein
MDLDYRTLSNAGLWCIGRLQTDADRARVVEGLSGVGDACELAHDQAAGGALVRGEERARAGLPRHRTYG